MGWPLVDSTTQTLVLFASNPLFWTCPARGAKWDKQSQKLCFFLYLRAYSDVRIFYFGLFSLPALVFIYSLQSAI